MVRSVAMEWQKHTERAIAIGHFPQNRIEYSSNPCSQTHGKGHILMTKGQGDWGLGAHQSGEYSHVSGGELGFLKHSSDHGQATQGYWEYSPEPMVVNPLWPMVPHFYPICFEPKGTHSHFPIETSILGSLQSFRVFFFFFVFFVLGGWANQNISL